MSDKLEGQFADPGSNEFDAFRLPADHRYDIVYEHEGAAVTEKQLDDFDVSLIGDIDVNYFLDKMPDRTESRMLAKMLGLFIRVSKNFLQQRYLVDDFKEHVGAGSRDQWHGKLADAGSPLLKDIKDNALKRGSMTKVAQPLGTLAVFGFFDFDDSLSSHAQALRDKLSIDQDEYDKKGVEEKISYVQTVKKELFDFLLSLSKLSTSQLKTE